nr:MAG TPA: hypothetical protein [Caudoviricetes sp.]
MFLFDIQNYCSIFVGSSIRIFLLCNILINHFVL